MITKCKKCGCDALIKNGEWYECPKCGAMMFDVSDFIGEKSPTKMLQMLDEENVTIKEQSRQPDAINIIFKENDDAKSVADSKKPKKEKNKNKKSKKNNIAKNNEEKQSNEIEYDNSNRIIKLGERKFSYDYYGRLISDSLKDESYSYDNFGNILTKRRGDKFYQYLYEDNLLKEIRNNEESIKLEYGTSLYPKKIIRTKDNKEENIELNYIGRRLEKVEVDGKEYKYTYDDQGQRIKKEGNGKEEYYFYEEERIKEVITKEYRLIYRYVGEEVKGVTYKNENKEISYFYEKNILGEIIGIVDEEGKRVVEYRSSSYGEVENIHDNSKIEISAKDHLRYKGYIYDEETRLYYLKTRYYDPESINGLNLYAYCGKDPINMVDFNVDIKNMPNVILCCATLKIK